MKCNILLLGFFVCPKLLTLKEHISSPQILNEKSKCYLSEWTLLFMASKRKTMLGLYKWISSIWYAVSHFRINMYFGY